MKLILSTLWWWLPTYAMVLALRSTGLQGWARWACAGALWLVGSGALTFGAVHIFGSRALSVTSFTLPVLLIALGVVLYLRRNFAASASSPAEHGLVTHAFTVRDLASAAVLSAVVFAFFALFAGSIASRGASSEYFAYASVARTWLSERNVDFTVLPHLLGDTTMPLAGWVRLSGAIAARQWYELSDRICIAFLLVVVIGFMAQRWREAQYSRETLVAVVALIVVGPGFITVISRQSDIGVLALLSLASLAAWIGQPSRALSLLFGLAAMLWNPALGWPVSLTATLLAMPRAGNAERQDRVWLAAIAMVTTLAMVALQSSVLLPPQLQHWFSANREPLLTWATLSSGMWSVLLILGAAVALLRRAGRGSAEGNGVFYFVLVLVALSVIALRRPLPSYLMTTDANIALNALLTLTAPTAILGTLAMVVSRVSTLSAYAGQSASAHEIGGTDAAVAVGSEQAHAQSPSISAPPSAVVEESMSVEEMRAKLLEGFNLYASGNNELAKMHANEVLSFDPQHPDANHLLALIALREDHPGDALRLVLRSLDVFPEHSLFHLTVAEIYGLQGRFEEQAFALHAASKLDPSNVATKTKLLLAKRKALMAQSQRAGSSGVAKSSDEAAYEIIVQRRVNNAQQ